MQNQEARGRSLGVSSSSSEQDSWVSVQKWTGIEDVVVREEGDEEEEEETGLSFLQEEEEEEGLPSSQLSFLDDSQHQEEEGEGEDTNETPRKPSKLRRFRK